jgi:hypothetical protein
MLVRRLLLLAAVLMLLTALAASIVPRDLTGGEESGPVRGPDDLPAGDVVTKEIPSTPGSNSRIAVSRGDTLELEVSGDSDTLDSVLIERLDRIDPIEPRTHARFNLLIDAPPGTYPIRLVEADRRIGSIVISD